MKQADIHLDETALQAAAEKMWGGDGWEAAGRCYPWDIEMADCQEAVEQVRLGVSAYLAAAGFESKGRWGTHQQLVGPLEEKAPQ